MSIRTAFLRRSACAALLASSALLFSPAPAVAQQTDLSVNTPAITALKETMRGRRPQLGPLFKAGALGMDNQGNVALRDANAVPLPQRAQVNSLISAENKDRAALYREIARANGHPEWEKDVRKTFAQRWRERAPAGWWIQGEDGNWKRK